MGTIIKNFINLEKDFNFNSISNLLDRNNLESKISSFDSFDFVQNDNGDTYFYADPLMESLMINKLDLMQKETGLELLFTYSFWRMYTMFADLKKHKDRESCEISVTVMIGSDGTKWPIFMDGTELNLEPGDAAIYLGCEIEHWREEFKGDWHAQCFLHYVYAEGPHKHLHMDGRPFWGMSKNYEV